MFSLKGEFEKLFYKLKDAEVPAKASFEDLCEQLDAGELRPMSLRHFGSKADDEDMETGTLQLRKIRASQDSEEPYRDFTSKQLGGIEEQDHPDGQSLHLREVQVQATRVSCPTSTHSLSWTMSATSQGTMWLGFETQTVDGVVLHKPSISSRSL